MYHQNHRRMPDPTSQGPTSAFLILMVACALLVIGMVQATRWSPDVAPHEALSPHVATEAPVPP